MVLNDKHRSELHASGISDAMIEAAGIYSGNGEVADILRWQPKSHHWGEGWVIPYSGTDGYARVKLDFPRHGERGRVVKYESPLNTPNRAYFPPGFFEALPSASVILLTEGEKKSLCAMQRGFSCIGLIGVWGFQEKRLQTDTGRKYGPRELIPDLRMINWKRRRVAIVYDSDAIDKRDVRLAESRLAEVLQREGAEVVVVRLPQVGKGKTGLDDFLVHHGDAGPDELKKLLSEAQPPIAPPAPDAMEWAKTYLESEFTFRDGLGMQWHRDEFFGWDGMKYRSVPDPDLAATVLRWLDEHGGPPKPRLANEIVPCLASLCRVPHTVDLPVWLGGGGDQYISMSNGLIKIDDLKAGKPEVKPHSPKWFSVVSLPYPFHRDAESPTWIAFLNRVLEDDVERISILQEWCGLNLIPCVKYHRFVVIEGEGANGKSVFTQVLEAMLGEDNVAHVPLEMFSGRFQLCTTIGKLANVIAEVSELAKPDEAAFKAFVAGDAMQIDRKHKDPIQVKPTARVTIATNTRPRWTDRSSGIWRRLLLVPFRVAIPEDEQDKTLAERIITNELPGVFNWAVEGLVRIEEQGGFSKSAVCEEATAEYRTEVNPARAFLEESCELAPGYEIKCNDLYQAYVSWCKNRGYRPLADAGFGIEVRRVFGIERFKKQVAGERTYYYAGIWAAQPEQVS